MSLISKILAGMVALMTIALVCVLLYARWQATEIGASKEALETTQQQLVDSQKSLQDMKAIGERTEAIVANTTNKTVEAVKKVQEINSGVDEVTKKVKDEKISTADADAAYTSSMWSTYCQAQPAGPHCTSGQSAN